MFQFFTVFIVFLGFRFKLRRQKITTHKHRFRIHY